MDEGQFGRYSFTHDGTGNFIPPHPTDYSPNYFLFTGSGGGGGGGGGDHQASPSIGLYLDPTKEQTASLDMSSPFPVEGQSFVYGDPESDGWMSFVEDFQPSTPSRTLPASYAGGTVYGHDGIKLGSPPTLPMAIPFDDTPHGRSFSQSNSFLPDPTPHDDIVNVKYPEQLHLPFRHRSSPSNPPPLVVPEFSSTPSPSTRQRSVSISPAKRPFTDLEFSGSNSSSSSSPQPAKKRIIKPSISIKLDSNEDFEIKKDSEKSPTGSFQGLFPTAEIARQKRNRLHEMYQKPKDFCTFPGEDTTFPQSEGETRAVVEKLFDAINDWSDFREWSQALKPDLRNRVMEEMRQSTAKSEVVMDASGMTAGDTHLDELRPSAKRLAELLPPLRTQQKRILGRLLSDQTVEWLCWDLVEAAILSQQGFSQIPHWCGADGA